MQNRKESKCPPSFIPLLVKEEIKICLLFSRASARWWLKYVATCVHCAWTVVIDRGYNVGLYHSVATVNFNCISRYSGPQWGWIVTNHTEKQRINLDSIDSGEFSYAQWTREYSISTHEVSWRTPEFSPCIWSFLQYWRSVNERIFWWTFAALRSQNTSLFRR